MHFFWGSFDLAVTRFSGRRAPPHPGGVPQLPDAVTREAYSHEVQQRRLLAGRRRRSSTPAFYAYAYPEPRGLSRPPRSSPPAPSTTARWASSCCPMRPCAPRPIPEAALLAFLQSTYDAAARRRLGPRRAGMRERRSRGAAAGAALTNIAPGGRPSFLRRLEISRVRGRLALRAGIRKPSALR